MDIRKFKVGGRALVEIVFRDENGKPADPGALTDLVCMYWDQEHEDGPETQGVTLPLVEEGLQRLYQRLDDNGDPVVGCYVLYPLGDDFGAAQRLRIHIYDQYDAVLPFDCEIIYVEQLDHDITESLHNILDGIEDVDEDVELLETALMGVMPNGRSIHDVTFANGERAQQGITETNFGVPISESLQIVRYQRFRYYGNGGEHPPTAITYIHWYYTSGGRPYRWIPSLTVDAPDPEKYD